MHTFLIRLQAFMVDNDPGWTEVRLTLANPCYLHYEHIAPHSPQPTHLWTLDDASLIGYPAIDEHHAAIVFAISLSMQSWRIFYSPVLLSGPYSWRVTPSPQVPSPTIGLTSPSIVVDEHAFLLAAAALKTIPTIAGNRGRILRAATNAYWDALHSVRTRPRFLSLYAAFELAVNACGKNDEAGKEFDDKAATLVRAEASEIEALRKQNNRLKHARAVIQFDEPTTFLGRESGHLKRVTDRALAARLHYELPSTYED